MAAHHTSNHVSVCDTYVMASQQGCSALFTSVEKGSEAVPQSGVTGAVVSL